MSTLKDRIAPTPTKSATLPLKLDLFATLTDALDYAAQGETGGNFFNLRGEVASTLSYAELRQQARALARRLASRFERGARIALVAETSPEFLITFFACQYAGLVPAPMPLPVNLGGKDGYLTQVRLMVAGRESRRRRWPCVAERFPDRRARLQQQRAGSRFRRHQGRPRSRRDRVRT